MLFWIFVGLMVVGIVAMVVLERTWNMDCWDWEYITFGMIPAITGGVAVFISLIIMAGSYCGLGAWCAQKNAKYELLMYQYEYEIYENDNDLGKRELMVDIQEWNEDLAWGRAAQDDPWIGIYVPDVYDQFDFIEVGE